MLMLDEILYLPLQSHVVAFADDLAVGTKASHTEIKRILEGDLLQISERCYNARLELSWPKCGVLEYPKSIIEDAITFEMGGQNVPRVNIVKYLGI